MPIPTAIAIDNIIEKTNELGILFAKKKRKYAPNVIIAACVIWKNFTVLKIKL